MNCKGYENVQRPVIYSRGGVLQRYCPHIYRQTMLHREQQQTGPCTAVCIMECLHVQRKQKKNLSNIHLKLVKHLHIRLVYYHMQYRVRPNLDQRLTGHVMRALNCVGWWTTQIASCGSEKQVAFCPSMDTLNGMCVHCLWGSEGFFSSRLFEANLHSREIDSIFCSDLCSFTRENSLSQGLLLKEFIYWFI